MFKLVVLGTQHIVCPVIITLTVCIIVAEEDVQEESK